MASEVRIAELKRLLRKGVARLCRRDDKLWKEPIVRTLQDLQIPHTRAVFFGGTLRSLLLGYIAKNKFGRPRDIDIVVADVNIEMLRDRFRESISRETRFGGLQLRRREWHFDLWPLHRTWAFVHDQVENPDFDALPSTTFFNLEAIAVEVWATQGQERQVFSGDDQFFEGILSRTIEINREENPFPSLCVVRGLVMAGTLGFAIGPKLAKYLTVHGMHLSSAELNEIQTKHYGSPRIDGAALRKWISHVSEVNARQSSATIQLPKIRRTHN